MWTPFFFRLLSVGQRKAAANAKHNYGMNKSKLYISRCWCDEGKMIKRPVARARGRSDVRKKPGCHITMFVKEK